MSPLPPPLPRNRPPRAVDTGYVRRLLQDLGVAVPPDLGATGSHPVEAWAECGLMHLTGIREGRAEFCPVPLPHCADGALEAFRLLCGNKVLPGVRGAQLLAERAAIAGLHRHGDRSPQGHCRLLPSGDGRIGLNLARDDDWTLLPALFGRTGDFDWESAAREIRGRSTEELVTRGRLLGLAVVDADIPPRGGNTWCRTVLESDKAPRPPGDAPLVVDLSSLWAGPLCTHLWQSAAARVIKVESRRRPDGGRTGTPEFFRLLNDGKTLQTLDFGTSEGRDRLRELILEADIVVEASRPRALRQMGIVAEELVAARPGLTWLSITGYGRGEPAENWVAYGDDAGISAGLSALLHRVTGRWLVCGDAIADPLTGLHAALAGWAAWQGGGGKLIDISLEGVVKHCIQATAPLDNDYGARYRRWRAILEQRQTAVRPPRRRGESHRHAD